MHKANSSASRPEHSAVWFALFVGVVCAWVLSLPLFPSQDGPMHRYYAHALGQVFAHAPHYSGYVVRHPFPPYATQYITLLGLFHLFSFATAEKVLTCLEILCFAYGLRLCATAIGPAGRWVSLLTVPLLLPWYLMMGFFNYSIGIGVALFAIAFWLRLDRSRVAIAGFAVSGIILIFSHPVPLLLLLFFLVADLLRRRFLIADGGSRWFHRNRLQLMALAYMVLLTLYPSLAIDKTKTASTLSDTGFHLPFVRTVMLLTGLSPYNTRSHGLLVNGYRLAAYALLIVSFIWGLRVFREAIRERELTVGASFLVYAVVFAVALPFLPDRLNGGVFFATRMVIMVWIFLLLASAGAKTATPRFRQMCIVLGAIFTVATLLPAEQICRPISRELRMVEGQVLPEHTNALILDGPMFTTSLRSKNDLAFNPMLWASVLPLVRQDDLVLNAPWLDLTISPLRSAPGSILLDHATDLNPVTIADPPRRFVTLVPAVQGEMLIQRSNVVMYAGTDGELSAGLTDFLGARDSAEFTCKRPVTWSLDCVRRSR